MKQCRSTCSVHGCGRHGRVKTGVIDCLHVICYASGGRKESDRSDIQHRGKKNPEPMSVSSDFRSSSEMNPFRPVQFMLKLSERQVRPTIY